MPKILRDKLNKNLKEHSWKALFKEIQKIKTINELKEFFDRFFTQDETVLFLRRLAVIELIEEKKKYRDIEKIIGVSRHTISAAKDILLGYGYNRRNKKKVYSADETKEKRKLFLTPPKMVGKGRWKFLDEISD